MPWAGPATLTEPTTLPPATQAPTKHAPTTQPTATRGATALGPPAVHRVTVLPAALATGSNTVPVSATLAANEALASRRLRGEPVLPLAFGESGLPVHPRLSAELADAAGLGAYGPVAGTERLRQAAAGYWSRRGLPTDPGSVVAGPGSKALLFGTLLALGTDVAVPRPSWVSYAAQATLIGADTALRGRRARRGRHLRCGGAGGCSPGQPGGRPAHRSRPGHHAGQPDRPTGKSGRRPRAVCRCRAQRPRHHQRRDLPRSRA